MYTQHKFYNLLTFKNHLEYNVKPFNLEIIPKEWILLLTDEGSFTQSLNSLTSKYIHTKIIKQSFNATIDKTYMREIWLTDELNTKLAFAKSIWNTTQLYKNINQFKLPKNQPIGQSFIKFEADIYKEIHGIYYGYSQKLNNAFNTSKTIWGRKYTIYYNHKPLTTIQEFFSPQLIQLF